MEVSAHIELMIYNNSPLSFLDVTVQDYAYAMMGVYEQLDTSLAADLFAWTSRRSIQKYTVVMESVGAPTHNCARYRLTMKTVEEWIKRGRRTSEI